MKPKPAGLYIHIPFCPKKCGYCNFYSVTALHQIPGFLQALYKEMDIHSRTCDFGLYDTLYLGGGSPSVLDREQIDEILKQARSFFDLAIDAEITMEVNPGDIDLAYLQNLHNLGVNRINIGVQSFDEKILAFLERRHNYRTAIDAIENSQKAGFENLGLDLIYGIPGQSIASWLDTLDMALTFKPAHLSCYQLTVEPGTPLGRKYDNGDFALPDDEMQYDFFMKTAETLEAAGYIHYEVSNFAMDMAHASRHNRKYWDHTPYLGLGPAAHSFKDNKRWWNHRSLEKYLEALKADKLPVEDSENLTEEQRRLETLLLSLRTKRGVDLEDYKENFGRDLLVEKGGIIRNLRDAGLIEIEDGYLRPTRDGLAVADSLSLI